MEQYEEYPQNNNDSIEYISELIDVEKELDRFTQEVLRGKMEIINDKNEKVWVDIYEDKKPMSELGVRGILSLLKGVVTKLSKLSNKTDDEIKTDMFYFSMTLTTQLYENYDDWELDMLNVESIKESCIRLAWDVAASSRDGFTAMNLRSQYSRSETTSKSVTPEVKNKGIFGLNFTK